MQLCSASLMRGAATFRLSSTAGGDGPPAASRQAARHNSARAPSRARFRGGRALSARWRRRRPTRSATFAHRRARPVSTRQFGVQHAASNAFAAVRTGRRGRPALRATPSGPLSAARGVGLGRTRRRRSTTRGERDGAAARWARVEEGEGARRKPRPRRCSRRAAITRRRYVARAWEMVERAGDAKAHMAPVEGVPEHARLRVVLARAQGWRLVAKAEGARSCRGPSRRRR